MPKTNISKTPPKGSVRFSLSLSEEQKNAKTEILNHPFNFIVGKAGSGKTLLAVQIALDQFFKRQCNNYIYRRQWFPSWLRKRKNGALVSTYSF